MENSIEKRKEKMFNPKHPPLEQKATTKDNTNRNQCPNPTLHAIQYANHFYNTCDELKNISTYCLHIPKYC